MREYGKKVEIEGEWSSGKKDYSIIFSYNPQTKYWIANVLTEKSITTLEDLTNNGLVITPDVLRLEEQVLDKVYEFDDELEKSKDEIERNTLCEIGDFNGLYVAECITELKHTNPESTYKQIITKTGEIVDKVADIFNKEIHGITGAV